jgi:hypothetical protein
VCQANSCSLLKVLGAGSLPCIVLRKGGYGACQVLVAGFQVRRCTASVARGSANVVTVATSSAKVAGWGGVA